jgi:hypothetical protein
MGFAADRTVTDPTLRPSSGDDGQKPRRHVGFIIAGAVLGLVAIAVAAIVLLNGSGGNSGSGSANAATTNTGAAYKQQLTKVLTPLVSANQSVSNSLTALNGSKRATNTAKTRTTAALSALSTARGGIGVVKVPASETPLSGQVQQALTADNGYLQAVSLTLATPTGTGAGQVQTLATGAQTAFVNLDPVVSGASASITGTNTLTSWAQGAKTYAHHAAKKHQAQTPPSSGSGGGTAPATPTPAPSPAPSPSTGSNCDQNISVDASTTTCQFADSVFAAYAAAVQGNGGPLSTTVTASSETTGQTYNDFCDYDSSTGIVSCSHGTDQIQFPEWAAADFNG